MDAVTKMVNFMGIFPLEGVYTATTLPPAVSPLLHFYTFVSIFFFFFFKLDACVCFSFGEGSLRRRSQQKLLTTGFPFEIQ